MVICHQIWKHFFLFNFRSNSWTNVDMWEFAGNCDANTLVLAFFLKRACPEGHQRPEMDYGRTDRHINVALKLWPQIPPGPGGGHQRTWNTKRIFNTGKLMEREVKWSKTLFLLPCFISKKKKMKKKKLKKKVSSLNLYFKVRNIQ